MTKRSSCIPRAAALLLLGCQLLSAQNVWVVEASGGGDFTQLADATAAATSGDILLVKSSAGVAPAFVTAKGLTIVGDGSIVPVGSLDISLTPAGSHVTLRALQPASDPTHYPIYARLVAGTSHFEQLELHGVAGLRGLQYQEAAGHLTLVDCMLTGGGHASFGGADGAYVYASQSFCAYGCTFIGGDHTTQQGGTGLAVAASFGLISGCSSTGGDSSVAGFSGPGTWVQDTVTFMRHQACTFEPGLPLFNPGLYVTGSADVIALDEPHRSFKLLEPVRREGQVGHLEYDGAPGDQVLGMASLAPVGSFLTGEGGVLHVAFPLMTRVYFGTAVTGNISITYGVPELGPGVDALPVYVQALVLDDDGLKLSAPSMVLLADAGL